jgi:hypothetical protein
MKKMRLVLLSLGLVIAFNASAFAVDVKLSGSFFVAGLYQDKTSFMKGVGTDEGGPSTAFCYQRLRLQTDFIIAQGLKIITRADIMKRAWGAARSLPGGPLDRESAGTAAENENIVLDWAYLEYITPIGLFAVGYQEDGPWGTAFGDSSIPQGMLSWFAGSENGGVGLQLVKLKEQSKTAKFPLAGAPALADNDTDKVQAAIFYKWSGIEAGLLGVYYRDASNRQVAAGELIGNIYSLQPYAIFKFGPVKIQSELQYAWGKIKADTPPGPFGQDLKIDNLIGWIDASVDIKMFYFGGTIAYVAGNDWSKFISDGTVKGGFLNGGMEWNPALILFNNERTYWAGAIPGNAGSTTNNNAIAATFGVDDTGMYNAWFFQGRVGIRPTEKLDVMASVSYAKADSKTWEGNLFGFPNFVSDVYGTEVDIVASYKITNNLSYMLGAGYLFTGDYFKGIDPNAQVRDNFLIINKLTLTF